MVYAVISSILHFIYKLEMQYRDYIVN